MRNIINKLFVLLFTFSVAFANTVRIDFGPSHSGVGGEFVVKPSTIASDVAASTAFVNSISANYNANAKGNGGFYTFCLEYNEFFTLGQNYQFQVNPSGAAIHGGESVSDPISVGTAYLYRSFAKGLLPGYHYLSSVTPWAKDLQNTLWFLENERVGSGGPFVANPGVFDALLIAEFGSIANSKLSAANSASYGFVDASDFGVGVLNVGKAPLFSAQDQVIYLGDKLDLPDNGSSLGLAGLGIMFLIGFGFKKN